MLNGLKVAFGTAAVIFLLAPLFAIMPLAFTSQIFLVYPIQSFSLRWFEELVTAPAWRMSIVNSLIISSSSALLATIVGTIGALGMRHAGPISGMVLRTATLLPMVIPAVVLGVGMQILFVRLGLANSFLGVIIAHAVLGIPFVVVSVSASLAAIDTRIEKAALSLGAAPGHVFRLVTLPLALPGILSGAVFAFATSLDEVVITLFLAGPNQRTLARQMFSSIRENISPSVVAAAFVMIIGTILVAAVIGFVKANGAQTAGKTGR